MNIDRLNKDEMVSHVTEMLDDKNREIARLRQERTASVIAASVLVALAALS